jgi:hypothetical protein
MNNESNIGTGTSKKIWTWLFIGILGLQAIVELALGTSLLVDFPTTLETGFGITYSSDLDVLGIALGLYLLLLTALLIISAVWTYRSNMSGITIGIVAGGFLLAFGLATYLKLGNFEGILVDGIRGLLTIVFAYMAGKEMKQ